MKFLTQYISLLCLGAVLFSSCEKDVYHADPLSLENIKALYKDVDITLPESRISGVVITDVDNGNHVPGYIVIQNQTHGMALELSTANQYKLGDSVVVDVTGKLLTRYQGWLQIRNVDADKVRKVTTNRSVVARAVSVSNLYNNLDKYENTLVRVLGDITPAPIVGETYKGLKKLQELSFEVSLFTADGASFANAVLPYNASFQGVVMGKSNYKVDIRMRNINDVANASGRIYAGFPESFEETIGYTVGDFFADLPSGRWKFNNGGLRNESTDRVVSGTHAVRLNLDNSSSAYAQMEFDVPNGASKVTVYYGQWGGDPSSTWRLEYSTNQGVTWQQIGEHVTDASSTAKLKTFMMDIRVPVRFRINKLGLGASTSTISNGRLNIDDFAIYQPL